MISEVRESKQKEIQILLKQLDGLVQIKGLPIFPEPKTGNPLWADVRELDLRYQIPVKKVTRFFDELGKGKITATKCVKCNTIYFPPQDDCPKCRVSGLEWVELPVEGELITYTIISVKPPSFSHYPDYVVGIADLGEVNVTAWVQGPKEKLKVGAKVRLEVVKREPEGYLTYSLRLL